MPLTPQEIEANKALGLHPDFWDTAIEIPETFTPEWLDAVFPAWRVVGQEIVNTAARAQTQTVEATS